MAQTHATRSGAGMQARPQAHPLSKLRGLTPGLRRVLKIRGITTCPQILEAAGPAEARAALAREAGVEPGGLLALARRADMARVDGVEAMFQLMLEELGVVDVGALAGAGAVELCARLRALNERERIVRRSPSLGEVEDWVAQARALPPTVECR